MRDPESRERLLLLLFVAGAAMLASCGKDSTGVPLGGVASVKVSPAADSVYVGSSISLTATPEDADGNPLSGREIFWHSEHPEIAIVSDEGAVTGIVPGQVRIAANVEGVPGFAQITVLAKPPASVTLSSETLSLTVGQGSRLQATVRDADGGVISDAPVDWRSSDTDVATVDDDGLVRGVGPGTAKITATSGNAKDEATVTVSPVPANAVVVSPNEATIFVGDELTLEATVTDSDGDALPGRPVSWSSSSPSVASVSSSGVVTARAPGKATITASSGGKSGKSTITVKQVPVASVGMDPGTLRLQIGQSATITATPRADDGTPLTGRSISWRSRDPGIAMVDGNGKVTAKSSGSTIVEATSEGVTGVTLVTVAAIPVSSVVVTPEAATLVVGQSKQLTAKTFDAGGTELNGRTITWSSSNEDVATVSSSGKVIALAPGTATITAASEGKSDKASITVVARVSSVTVSPDSISLIVGDTRKLAATVKDDDGNTLEGRDVTWKSGDEDVATVDDDGVVTAVAPGVTTVTATSEGKSGSAKVVVTPEPVDEVTVVNPDDPDDPISVVEGESVRLVAVLTAASGDTLSGRDVEWTSDDPGIATVVGNGESAQVTGVKAGEVRITATSEGRNGSVDITVTSAAEGNVIIIPGDTTLAIGESATLRATVVGSDGVAREDHSLSWTSDNPGAVRVSGDGVVQAVFLGTAHITATRPGATKGNPGTATVNVVLLKP